MNAHTTPVTDAHALSPRVIVYRTLGHGSGGPITRLMSPSDLGQSLKPFVFLDIFDAQESAIQAMAKMPLHPHSGIATVTVFTEGHVHYDDPASGSGTIGYGGVEWMRAGLGVWHGKEMTAPADATRIQGFQLWLALPEALELSEPQSHYIEAQDVPKIGPAHVVIGRYDGAHSPVNAPDGINYLLVTLQPGERWTYSPPPDHTVAWLAVASGKLDAGAVVQPGEMVVFADEAKPIVLEARGLESTVFVLGSAIPHPHPLRLGNYSVHTSAQALAVGEGRIRELGQKLKAAEDRVTPSGTVPVFK
ncbi:redox-sensitive bicupin YhaK (pirin superfamily) [Comamonas sp. BIGb0152]|uniref:pirin family protein n=1 Tax=Comamonas sp. BIGb0152 TaxID=2940601 RepID=UPI002169A5BE|nr:pirin family protein [Comamonas sp. BIGb0152]MCS4296200.1 redox-sensitive bicupin YhaK (pirin superfamily) [Comamonas sp. BIGb0152]